MAKSGRKAGKQAQAAGGGRGEDRIRVIARNRRARHDYEVLDSVEAGIALLGPEVKSLRAGRANLVDAYATVRRGEVLLQKLHISPYEPATRENPEPQRERRLLLHRQQIQKLKIRITERGFTLIPLSLYFKNGRAKVELALVRGKRQRDRREDIKRRDADLEARRAMRGRGGRSSL